MFNINNSFISFDEPLNDWFKDEISLHFERDRRVFKDTKNQGLERIKNYKNINTLQKNTFISYNNISNNPKFKMIRIFNNNTNFAFERIGFKEIPPKRVIIKDFDD